MQVITSLDDLAKKISECNDTLNHQSDDAMRRMFGTFRMDFSNELPSDPFSSEYRHFQAAIHERITGRRYAVENERSVFDAASMWRRPFPFYTGSCLTAGHHLTAIGFLLRHLDLPAGARVLEFGPGWGNTTLALALLGMHVTAVEIAPSFCEVIRTRAAQDGLAIEVIESDFFWAETVTEPYDAVIFFECFHHCDDHVRLLRALHGAVKPEGTVYFASEPITPDYPIPWGRADGRRVALGDAELRLVGTRLQRGVFPPRHGEDRLVGDETRLAGHGLGGDLASAQVG
ncbi:MAG: class I SAM-dependent methyltransferase [Pseudomonadota bacterium]|nr:class I SAM-dependent methyltransferase [Pseudomonadota bacterium]